MVEDCKKSAPPTDRGKSARIFLVFFPSLAIYIRNKNFKSDIALPEKYRKLRPDFKRRF
jgi:hypothetical protein